MLILQMIAVFSTVSLIAGLYQVMRAAFARRWPHVDGAILQAQAIAQHRGKGVRQYTEHVTYSYAVEDRRYQGHRTHFGFAQLPASFLLSDDLFEDPIGLEQASRAIAAKRPPASRVRVFYNPRNPADSTLNTEANITAWGPLAAGLAGLGIAAYTVGLR